MSAIYAAVDDVVQRLRAAGIRATAEPRDINPPAVWVTVGSVAQTVLCGDPEVTVSVVLVARDIGQRRYLATLSELYDEVTAVVAHDGQATPESVTLPAGGTPLPALTLTILPD